jgi:hypothetical protein
MQGHHPVASFERTFITSLVQLTCTWVRTCLQGWCRLVQLPVGAAWQWHHGLGLGLWAAGWLANMRCDDVLRNLRKSDSDSGGWSGWLAGSSSVE